MQSSNEVTDKSKFVVVGGGIAGVTCVETISMLCPNETIILLTESTLVKKVTNLEPLSKYLYKFEVKERKIENTSKSSNIITIVDSLQSIETISNRIHTLGNRIISYQYLCICTGGQPKLIDKNNSRVIGIRDTDSVLILQQRIKASRKLVLVGNGGIASELAYAVKNIEMHWVIKNDYIASTFLDPGAANFIQQSAQLHNNSKPSSIIKRMRYSEILSNKQTYSKRGAALGPDWHTKFDMSGTHKSNQNSPKIYLNAHIKSIESRNEQFGFPLLVTLSTGEKIGCDFLVSATGIIPRFEFTCDQNISLSDDGFILVDSLMKTNIEGIFAAGDICRANWKVAENWFQMRLWTQARQMGSMAGRSMVAAFYKEDIFQDFCFELFGHVTTLFGFQVILLGCFNGQCLGTDYEVLLRSTPGKEYIKFVLCHGKLRGAILMGNTELAETCENLILNGLDLSAFGDDILNPDIDIEDFFD